MAAQQPVKPVFIVVEQSSGALLVQLGNQRQGIASRTR